MAIIAVAVPTTWFLACFIYYAIKAVLAAAWPYLAFIFFLYLGYLGHQQEVAKKEEEQKKKEEEQKKKEEKEARQKAKAEAFSRILEEIGRG